MPASGAEQSSSGVAPRPAVLVALIAASAAAVAYAAGQAGLPVAPMQIAPVVAAEIPANNNNEVRPVGFAVRPVGFADVVEKVKPAVFTVRIEVGGTDDDGERGADAPGLRQKRSFRGFGLTPNRAPARVDKPRLQRTGQAQGSGFFISPDGYAVTNEHVVEQGRQIEIVTDDGRTYPARLVGADVKTDLAVIKIDGRNDFPYVRFGSAAPRIGDWVFAVGNPFGLGGTVTAGIVSARGRDIGSGPYDDFIQIDAPVNQGNSGGPTFDVDGNVIGVNTAIFSPNGGSVGIAFAMPADIVQKVAAQLRSAGKVTRGWAGLQIQPVTAEIAESLGLKQAGGALVAQIEADSPAAKSDITAGDVITSIGSEPVKDNRDLSRKIGDMAPGTGVKLGVLRKGTARIVALTLGELVAPPPRADVAPPPARSPADLGLTLAPAGQVRGAGGRGVVVIDAKRRGNGAEHGLETGDVILEVGGKAVNSADDVRSALIDAHRGGKRLVMLRVQSGATNRFLAIPVG